jgi:hypothetical protein
MAQESRITSFEKALKDEGIAGTNLESVARSIFQQESSSGANVKTSNAGARGPMQVLPATFKAYNPQGNIDDPYDNSVGGLRYIKDLFSKTNDLGLTAVGYYGGPKAIEKAKQGVAVSDPRNPNAPNTLQYMEQVMGRTKGSQPQPAPRGNKPPVNPLIKQKITDLGPSYQAALALMAKADDLDEAREKIAEEEELASAGADFSQAKQMLAQIKPTSPFPAQEPRRMAEGGEVEKKPEPSMGEKVKGTAKEILRSTQYTPYDLLGAPVDIINLGLKGVDYVTGSKLATEKPVGGSDYLIQKSRELGIADKPTGSTTETLTRLGTGIISPTAGPRAVAAAGQAVKGTAKAALEDLAMASTGQGGSNLAQKIMAPGTAFAVRPKGGVYLGAKSVDEPVLTDFDLRIKEIVDNLDKSDPQQKEVASFFDKKVRNYIMNQQGTVDDPIFKKMMTGEIPNFTYASQEVIDAARAGDKAALAEVRNAYDASLSINALVGRKQLKESGKTQHQLEKALKKKIQEQSPDDYITALMASVYKFEPEDIKKYPALYGSPGFKQFAEESESGALLRMMNKSDLPPHIRRAIAEGEPIFASNRGGIGGDRAVDAQELQDYLLTRNPNDIKNMGFADAVVQSKQWHARLEAARRDPSKFSPKQLYEGTKDVLPVADSMKWVDLRTPDALSLEGNIMGHCVGGSGYCSGVAKDTTKILSLRDKKGIPHVTIELRKGMDNKFNTINQIKGVGNKPAEKYFPQIEEFLNDYSAKLGDNLYITEGKSYLPPNWRNK